MLDEQVRHIAEVIQHAEQRQAQVIEPTAEAEAEWVQTIRDTPNAGEQFYMQCTPGYYNGEGHRMVSAAVQRTLWGGAGGVLRPRAGLARQRRDEGSAVCVTFEQPCR